MNAESALPKGLLFLDIETVACQATFEALPERLRAQWAHKASRLGGEASHLTAAELFEQRAGIYAEFGKVIVIGLSFFHPDEAGQRCLRAKTLAGGDERALLTEFAAFVEKFTRQHDGKLVFCAHNGFEFDYPYLCRRMLVNGLPRPRALQLDGASPWRHPHLDTLDMWKFGDRKNYTSLELLAALFEIPSSKTDLSGDQVNGVFYRENDLPRIRQYCLEDVVVLAQLFLRYQNLPLIPEERITRLG
jgi:hypothetical protein